MRIETCRHRRQSTVWTVCTSELRTKNMEHSNSDIQNPSDQPSTVTTFSSIPTEQTEEEEKKNRLSNETARCGWVEFQHGIREAQSRELWQAAGIRASWDSQGKKPQEQRARGWGGDAGTGDCKQKQGEKPQRRKDTRQELSDVLMTFYKQKAPSATFTQKERMRRFQSNKGEGSWRNKSGMVEMRVVNYFLHLSFSEGNSPGQPSSVR